MGCKEKQMKKIKKNIKRLYFEQKLAALCPASCLRWMCQSCNAVIPSDEMIVREDGFFHDCNGSRTQLVLNEKSLIWEHEFAKYWGFSVESLWRKLDPFIAAQDKSSTLFVITWKCNLCEKHFETLETRIDVDVVLHRCCADADQTNWEKVDSAELGEKIWQDIEVGESLITGYVEWLDSKRERGEELVRVRPGIGRRIIVAVVITFLLSLAISALAVIALNPMWVRSEHSPSQSDETAENDQLQRAVETEYEREKRLMQQRVDDGKFPTREEVEYYKLKVPDNQYWEWGGGRKESDE